MENTLNILLTENNKLFLQRIIYSLESAFPKANIVVTTKNNLLNLIGKEKYDLYILGFEQESTYSPIDRILKNHYRAKIIVYLLFDNIWTVQHLVSLNVKGILLKNSKSEELVYAVNNVLKDAEYYCSRFAYLNKKKIPLHKNDQLSARELEVLKFIAEGKITEEVANELGISTYTVETHRRNIKDKLNATTPSHVISLAFFYGLLKLDDLNLKTKLPTY